MTDQAHRTYVFSLSDHGPVTGYATRPCQRNSSVAPFYYALICPRWTRGLLGGEEAECLRRGHPVCVRLSTRAPHDVVRGVQLTPLDAEWLAEAEETLEDGYDMDDAPELIDEALDNVAGAFPTVSPSLERGSTGYLAEPLGWSLLPGADIHAVQLYYELELLICRFWHENGRPVDEEGHPAVYLSLGLADPYTPLHQLSPEDYQ